MRAAVRALVALSLLAMPAGLAAQTPAQPARELNVVKLSKMPDSVAPATQKIPDEFATPEAKQIRQILPGDPQRADAFHNTLVEAGFDISQGTITQGAGETVIFETKGPEGTTRIVGVPTLNGVTLHKQLILPTPGLPPVVFRQPAPPAPPPPQPTTPPPTSTVPLDLLPPGERPFIYVFPPGTTVLPEGFKITPSPFNEPPGFFTPLPDSIRDSIDDLIDPAGEDVEKLLQEFKDDLNEYLKSRAGNPVTDPGIIAGFTLIEGGCDFLDDGSPLREQCSTNTPTGDWPNVMVQVLDQNGFRFAGTQPLIRDEARIEKIHILGGGGAELLGSGNDGVIKDLAPATYDNSVQYELINFKVAIPGAMKKGFNLLRDWLLRRPQALAARSDHPPVVEQARPAPSRPSASSRARSALSLLVTSTGMSTGEAFRVQALANSPIAFEMTSVVAEPLKGVKPNAIAKASSVFAARGAQTTTAIGYCLEFMRQPPSAGMLYRIAGPEMQKRFEPLRKVANAARKLSEAGQLPADSEPKSYAHSITQWAVWSAEQKFTQSSYTQALVDHTRKSVEASGRPWQRQFAQAIEKAAPSRWQQIQRILRLAEM